MEKALPPIPAKRYFTIGEVSELCGVKPYVLRYWEQEFTQLKPMKRRGNRRYYQHHEVLLVRRIRELLYDQGFTISGARNRLADAGSVSRPPGPDERAHGAPAATAAAIVAAPTAVVNVAAPAESAVARAAPPSAMQVPVLDLAELRAELRFIRGLLDD
jgi:DNA-binding transcriptional MerR regulator